MSNPILNNFNRRLEKVRGVIQAGMGGGSYEIAVWKRFGIRYQVYIEPYPPHFHRCVQVASPLSEDVRCFQVALSNVDGIQDFHVCNENDSHSLLDLNPDRHDYTKWMDMYSKIEVKCRRLDTLIEEEHLNMANFNLLFLDTQSTEHLVIEGAKKNLHHFDYVCIEAPADEVYKGAILRPGIDALMLEHGYVVEAESPLIVTDGGGANGIPLAFDVLYTKKELVRGL